MKKTKRLLAIIMALVMTFSFAMPAMAYENGNGNDYVPYIIVPEEYPSEEYEEEEELPAEYEAAYIGFIPFGSQFEVSVTSSPDSSTNHEIINATHTFTWDAVDNAVDYNLLIFASPTETNPDLALRVSTPITGTTVGNVRGRGANQNETLFTPLPLGDYYVRVRANFSDGTYSVSDNATAALQFTTRITVGQQRQVIREHAGVAPGTPFVYSDHDFIIIDLQDAVPASIFEGAINIPMSNTVAAPINQRAYERILAELRVHPLFALHGYDVLIFTH